MYNCTAPEILAHLDTRLGMMADFDFPAMASVIASLVGVFASLAFTVLVLYLAQNNLPGHDDTKAGVASSLLVACVALCFNAMYFAIIVGTTTSEVALLTLAHVPTLAISLLLLLLAITIASGAAPYMAHARMLCKVMTIVVGPVIVCGFFTLGAFALARDDCTGCGYFGSDPWYTSPTLWGVGVMATVLAATFWLVRLPDKPAKDSRAYRWPAHIGVAMIVMDFLLQMAISLFTPLGALQPSNGLLIAGVVGNGLVMACFAYACTNALRRTP